MRIQVGILGLIVSVISACGHKDRGDKERLARENEELRAQSNVVEEEKKQTDDEKARLEATLAEAQKKASKASEDAKTASAAAERTATDLAVANAAAIALQKNLNATTAAKNAADKNALDAKNAKDAADLKVAETLNAKAIADKNVEIARTAEESAKKENEANKKALASAQADLSALTDQKSKLDAQVQQLNSSLSADRKEKDGLKESLDKVKSSLDASLHGDPLSNLMNDWTNNLAKIISRISELNNPPVAELRAALTKAGVTLSENPSQDELTTAINALNVKVTQSNASVEGLQKSLKDAEEARAEVISDLRNARSESDRLSALAASNTSAAISPLAGIWMAEGTDNVLPKDCLAFFLVGATPNQIMRAVVCDNGNIETSTIRVDSVSTGASRFPGALQFTTSISPAGSSCTKDESSRIPSLAVISFDLHTVSGGEVSSYGFTNFGSEEIDIHSAAGITELYRTKDCSKIVGYANSAGDGASRILKAASKVCQIEKQTTGCFTTDNKFAPTAAAQPVAPAPAGH